ncbi:MAG: replication protein RepA [Steroidobacteraceae bacterium]
MTAEAGEGESERARFEKALRLYAQIGLAPSRTVRQLLRAGFPVEWVRAAFPQQPAQAFETPAPPPPVPRAPSSPVITASASRVPPSTIGAVPPLKGTEVLAGRVLEHLDFVRSQPSVAVPSAPRSGDAPLPAHLSEGVSFQYVPLIQCSFPHADPGAQTQFTRRNGWLELTLSTARPDTGLPYGVPARLLTIYCASEAIRTRSPEIFLGASVHDFLRRLDIPITRGDRGSLRVYANQLLRLIHCALTIDENIRDARGRTGLHIRQALFVEEARLWWDEATGVGQGSSLVLSPVLFDSILERSAPLSTRAIRQLRKSPMDLDVYAWLVHRLFQLTRPSTIPWPQLSGQFGHGYTLLRKFRTYFAESLRRVREVYPEAHLELSETGVTLRPSNPHIPRDALTARS